MFPIAFCDWTSCTTIQKRPRTALLNFRCSGDHVHRAAGFKIEASLLPFKGSQHVAEIDGRVWGSFSCRKCGLSWWPTVLCDLGRLFI